MNETLMTIDINFLSGSVAKYRRHRETYVVDSDTNEKILFTMLQDGNTLFDLAKSLTIKDEFKSISYRKYRDERDGQPGVSIDWFNPPKEFPEQYLKGTKIKFKCLKCKGIKQHRKDCKYQDDKLLIVDTGWVRNNFNKLELDNYVSKEDGFLYYTKLPGNSINQQKNRATTFNRIEIKIEEKGYNYYVHVYENQRIRIVHLPFNPEWIKKSIGVITYLNTCGENVLKEDIEFDRNYSFVSLITNSKRLIDKNDRNIGLTLNLKEMAKDNGILRNYQTKYGLQVNYKVLHTIKLYTFNDIFIEDVLELGIFNGVNKDGVNKDGVNKEEYEPVFKIIGDDVKKKLVEYWNEKRTGEDRKLEDYQGVFKQPFIEIREITHSTGAIQRFYKTLTYDDLYLNILFLECLIQSTPEQFDVPGELIEGFKEIKIKIIKIFIESFRLDQLYLKSKDKEIDEKLIKLLQIDNVEIKLGSVAKYTKTGKEPPGKLDIVKRSTQPFKRGLYPYSFKGRILYKDTMVDYKGKLDKNTGLYYPSCSVITKNNLKDYISTLIQGFPKDALEANKYGMIWNEEKGWVDEKSAILPKYEENGRVIKPLGNINLDKFIECANKKSKKIQNSRKANEQNFTFLQPLTIDKLFTISGKKLSAQVIPEESLIAYCYKNIVYYIFKGEILETPYQCIENGHGFILNKEFFPMDYDKCDRKEDILQYCEDELNKSLKNKKISQLLFFTEEGEGFYWNSKGYTELNCCVNISNVTEVSIKDEDNNNFKVTAKKGKQGKKRVSYATTLKEFPRHFFYRQEIIKKLKSFKGRFVGEKILVNGVYNDFGKLYEGRPLKSVENKNKEIYKNTIKNNLNTNLNLKAILRCFRKKNIENFIRIVHPVELNFFTLSTKFYNHNFKKINIPFSTQDILNQKVSDFTKQFIEKQITLFEQSAVLFYDEGDTIKFFYTE